MRRAMCMLAASCFVCPAIAGSIWTETFDNGVGRFTITTGQGDTVFVHNAVDANLNATFVRRDINQEPVRDTRLADLGQTFTEEDIFGYSFVWTPVSESGTPHPLIGLFRSSDLVPAVVVDIDQPDFHVLVGGAEVGGGDHNFWSFGNTYLVEFMIDGPQQTIGLRNSRQVGATFQLQDEFSYPWPNWVTFDADMIGFGNIRDDQGFGATFVMEIDNFSFVPEPSTALLFAGGALVLLRRRW